MKLYYYQDDMPNFGDDLNLWLWPKILPSVLDQDANHLMLGIGSILNDKLPKAEKYTVLGSGWGYGPAPKIDENWNILCVRGKISCDALNLDSELAIIDPAYLLQDYIKEPVVKKYAVSLIPHALSLEIGHWEDICQNLGIHLIDPRTTDIEFFVKEVRASEKILTEAMHGAIIADCFGVPWLGYSAYDHINATKWNDWLSVLDQEVTLEKITSLYKGYCDSKISFIVKNEIKIMLKAIGLWQSQWYEPIPHKSSNKTQNIIIAELQKMIDRGEFSFSGRSKVTKQLALLREKIKILKN
ncbi:MAG: polysaccharide pyruvyl transferase family protein [Colwellia sp.]